MMVGGFLRAAGLIPAFAGLCLVSAVPVFAGFQSAVAQVTTEQNLRTCLDGRYPSLCDRTRLTPSQRQQADTAERAANLNTCLDGRYPSLCRHALLTPEERGRVDAAERRANFEVCRTGQTPSLCRRHLLTPDQQRVVNAAERQHNLTVCLDGRTPSLCQRNLLSAEEKRRVAEAERRAGANAPRVSPPLATTQRAPATSSPRRARLSGCEDGLWIDRVAANGAILMLSDGSVWRVDPVDTVVSSIWLPVTDVIVCDDEIINVDDRESVAARRVR